MRIKWVLMIGTVAAGVLMPIAVDQAKADEREESRGRSQWRREARGHIERWRERGGCCRERAEQRRERDRSAGRGEEYDRMAVEPFWAYPPEYYIMRRHPSQYYYTFPDRYYSRRYYSPEDQIDNYYRARPYRYDTYGYREPEYRRYRDYDPRDDDYYRDREYRDRGYRWYRQRIPCERCCPRRDCW